MNTTQKLLDDITEFLSERKPNWDKIRKEIKKKNYEKHLLDISHIPGTIAEIHLHLSLDELSEKFDNIDLNPIRNNTQTENFIFNKTSRNTVLVKSKNSKHLEDYIEFDQIIKANNIPLVFESKLTMMPTSTRRDKNGLGAAFSGYFQRKVNSALCEIFNTDNIPIFLLIYPGVVPRYQKLYSYSINNMIRFVTKNGFLIPLYAEKDKFYDDIKKEIGFRYLR